MIAANHGVVVHGRGCLEAVGRDPRRRWQWGIGGGGNHGSIWSRHHGIIMVWDVLTVLTVLVCTIWWSVMCGLRAVWGTRGRCRGWRHMVVPGGGHCMSLLVTRHWYLYRRSLLAASTCARASVKLVLAAWMAFESRVRQHSLSVCP